MRPARFAVLPLQGFQPVALVGGRSGRAPRSHSERRTQSRNVSASQTHLLGDRADRRPLRAVLGLVIAHQPDGTFAQLNRVRLRRLPRFPGPHPAESRGLRETRCDSAVTSRSTLSERCRDGAISGVAILSVSSGLSERPCDGLFDKENEINARKFINATAV